MKIIGLANMLLVAMLLFSSCDGGLVGMGAGANKTEIAKESPKPIVKATPDSGIKSAKGMPKPEAKAIQKELAQEQKASPTKVPDKKSDPKPDKGAAPQSTTSPPPVIQRSGSFSAAEIDEETSTCPAQQDIDLDIKVSVNSVYLCVRPIVNINGDNTLTEILLPDGNINGSFSDPSQSVGYLEGPEIAVFHWKDYSSENCPDGVPHCAQISQSEAHSDWAGSGRYPYWGNTDETIEIGSAYYRLRSMIRNYFDRYNSIPLPISGVEPEDKLVVLLGKPLGYPAQMSRSRRLVQLEDNNSNQGYRLTLAGGDIKQESENWAELIVGIPDMIIGENLEAGKFRVYYGAKEGRIGSSSDFDQASFGSTAEEGDSFGGSLAIGDFDGDNNKDLAVGSHGESQNGESRSGFVHIFYGDGSVIDSGNLNVINQVSAGEDIEADDQFGYSMAAGDFNSDGIDDLAVGSPFEDLNGQQNAGIVHVFFGTSDGLGPSSTSELTQISGGSEIESDDYFGYSMTTGDFDGDGIDDLAVGSPGEHQSGKSESGFVHVFYGSINGFDTSRKPRINQAFGGSEIDTGDRFGHAMTAGDFDGDGIDDLAVGSPGEEQDGAQNSGLVHVFFGAGSRFSTGDVEKFGQNSIGRLAQAHEQFGFSLTSGDMNDDGFDDLAVGSPFRTVSEEVNAGSVQLFPGRSDRTLTEDFYVMENVYQGANNDMFGKSITFVDLRGTEGRDGGDDLAISVPERGTNYVYIYNNDFPCSGSCMRPWSGDTSAQSHKFRIFADTRPDGRYEGTDETSFYWKRPKIFIRNGYTKEEMSKVQLHEFVHYYHRVFVKKYAPNYGMNGGFDRLSDECEEQALDEGLGYWYASDFADRRWLGRTSYWNPGRQLVYSNGVTSSGCQTSGEPEEHHLGDILTDAFWNIRQLPGTDKDLWTEVILNLVDTISPSEYGNSDPTGGASTIKGFANMAYDQANSLTPGVFTGAASEDACIVLLDHELRSDCP